jgi:hypothetical protein
MVSVHQMYNIFQVVVEQEENPVLHLVIQQAVLVVEEHLQEVQAQLVVQEQQTQVVVAVVV